MKVRIDEEMVRYLWALRPVANSEEAAPMRVPRRSTTPITLNEPSAEPVGAFAAAPRQALFPEQGQSRMPARTGGDDAPVQTVRRDEPKVGRNDPCPCGSGKKYKKCHGAAQP